MNQSFQIRKDFLSLTAQDESTLQRLNSAFLESAPTLVDDFYQHLMLFPEMQKLIADEQTLERLKKTQARYFESLTAGVYDEAYEEDRLRVGHMHARIGLSPGWYLGAYSHYVTELLPRLQKMPLNEEERSAAIQAFMKVIFLDMGLAIDSYIVHRDQQIAELRDYSAIFALLPYGTLVAKPNLEVVFSNKAFARLMGSTPDALVGLSLSTLLGGVDLTKLVEQAMSQQPTRSGVQLLSKEPALPIPAIITAQMLHRPDGESPLLLLNIEDLRERELLARDLLNAQTAADVGIWHTTYGETITLTPHAKRIIGWPEGKPFRFSNLADILHPEDRERVMALRKKGLKNGHYVLSARVNRNGETRWLEERGRVDRDANGKPIRAYGTILDVTKRHQAILAMEQLASYDTLTNLPNRAHGLMLAQRLLDETREQGQQAAIMFVDLDKFKEVNDTQGHAIGDRVLAAVAQQGKLSLGERSVLARLGGDEFMVAIPLNTHTDAVFAAERVQEVLQQPVSVGSLQFQLGASIGVALYPAHGDSLDELLRCADTAMYRAKKQHGGYLFYDYEMGQQVQRRAELGARLTSALTSSSLELHFQPKLDVRTGQLRGAEALARWNDPEWGWVSPTEFISAAEERGLIKSLGEWSLTQAARQWRAWQDSGVENPPPVSVNISATQLMNDDFADRALELVCVPGANPSAIELEITESALILDYNKAHKVASRLVEMGFSLSMDDFGSGYSSLARLHDLPVSRIKIDMKFVRGIIDQPRSLAVVTAVINMARALKLRTVADGVETLEQLEKLRNLGCDEAQGFMFAKALPGDEFQREWLSL